MFPMSVCGSILMQNSLFDEISAESNETVDEINQELLEKGKAVFPDKFFIFGTGKIDSDVVIVGESPGAPDADSEKPFMGPVGEFLVKILASIGLKREEVYLTNVVKFISAGDELTPEILKFFTPFLHREIARDKSENYYFAWKYADQSAFKYKKIHHADARRILRLSTASN